MVSGSGSVNFNFVPAGSVDPTISGGLASEGDASAIQGEKLKKLQRPNNTDTFDDEIARALAEGSPDIAAVATEAALTEGIIRWRKPTGKIDEEDDGNKRRASGDVSSQFADIGQALLGSSTSATAETLTATISSAGNPTVTVTDAEAHAYELKANYYQATKPGYTNTVDKENVATVFAQENQKASGALPSVHNLQPSISCTMTTFSDAETLKPMYADPKDWPKFSALAA